MSRDLNATTKTTQKQGKIVIENKTKQNMLHFTLQV